MSPRSRYRRYPGQYGSRSQYSARPRRARRRRPRRNYTLAHLLARQPKSLQKHEHYELLIRYYQASETLQTLRFSRRCYSLLHHARIAPENLRHFYGTYRLPKSPFFPLFLAIKRDYLETQARRQEERRQYILSGMRELPPPILRFVKYLGYLEEHYNRSARHPLWQKYLFPGSKKRLHEYQRYGELEWLGSFRYHLERLGERYPGVHEEFGERILACYLLECIPAELPPRLPPVWPDPATVQAQYRRLSKRHHPDRGGNGALFVELKRARDLLLT